MTPRLLRSKEAAAYLAMSVKRLRELVQEGAIPYLPGEGANGAWRFDVRDLDTFVEQTKLTLGAK